MSQVPKEAEMSAGVARLVREQIRTDQPSASDWSVILNAALHEIAILNQDGSLNFDKLHAKEKFNSAGGGFTEIYVWGPWAEWRLEDVDETSAKSVRCIVVGVNEPRTPVEVGSEGKIEFCLLNKKCEWGLLVLTYIRTGAYAFATIGYNIVWRLATEEVVERFDPYRAYRAISFFVERTDDRREELHRLSSNARKSLNTLGEYLEVRMSQDC